jgi:hypothetical protein
MESEDQRWFMVEARSLPEARNAFSGRPNLIEVEDLREVIKGKRRPFGSAWVQLLRKALGRVGAQRSRFAKQMLYYLERIQPIAGSPEMEVCVDGLLRTMRQVRDHCADDPFVEVVLALYDALAADQQWAKFSQKQYAAAFQVIKRLGSKARLTPEDVENAVLELEEAGFDTTPYALPATDEESSAADGRCSPPCV